MRTANAVNRDIGNGEKDKPSLNNILCFRAFYYKTGDFLGAGKGLVIAGFRHTTGKSNLIFVSKYTQKADLTLKFENDKHKRQCVNTFFYYI